MPGLLLKSHGLVTTNHAATTDADGAPCCCGPDDSCVVCAHAILLPDCGVSTLPVPPELGYCCECGSRFDVHVAGTGESRAFYTRDWYVPGGGSQYSAGPVEEKTLFIEVTAEWGCVPHPVDGSPRLRVLSTTGLYFFRQVIYPILAPPIIVEERYETGSPGLEQFAYNQMKCDTQAATLWGEGSRVRTASGQYDAYPSPPCTGARTFPPWQPAGTLRGTSVWANAQGCTYRRASDVFRVPYEGFTLTSGNDVEYVGESNGTFDIRWTLNRREGCRDRPCDTAPNPPPPEHATGCCRSRTRPPEVTTAAECFERGILRWDQGQDCDGSPLPGGSRTPSLQRIAYLGSLNV